MSSSRTFRSLILSGLLAVATVAVYWLFLGRDTTKYLDPETGAYAGPYTQAQVVWFAVVLLVLLAVAVLAKLHPALIAAVMTLAVLIPWVAQAAATDESGLYGVGAFMLLVGMGGATLVLAGAGAAARKRLTRTA